MEDVMRRLAHSLLTITLFSTLAVSQDRVPAQPTSLKDIHRVFVEPMEDGLDGYIKAEFTKQLRGQVVVVLDKSAADAILTGQIQTEKGRVNTVLGRYFGLKDLATGSVSLVAPDGKEVLWASEAGDRSIWLGAWKRGGARKVADRIVHMKDGIIVETA